MTTIDTAFISSLKWNSSRVHVHSMGCDVYLFLPLSIETGCEAVLLEGLKGQKSVFIWPPAFILKYINHGSEMNHVLNFYKYIDHDVKM